MSLPAFAYDNALFDIMNGTITTSSPNLHALLADSTYLFDQTETNLTNLAAAETTGSGYARFSGTCHFTIATVGSEVQYGLSATISFATFSTTDWQFIAVFNASSNAPYFIVDAGQANQSSSDSLNLVIGSDPVIRVVN